ncbi:MAG: T9SS type A sorting domain-containing protein [Bacteroidetes bacterium]|nr:T9SS type A sorting domain-containing protein [Bacteroidota bacterium]
MSCLNAVDLLSSQTDYTISPNPTSGVFTFQSSEKITGVEIMNVLGEEITPLHLSPKGESVVVSLPSGLGQGIYFVQIKTAEGVVAKKIVVQR